jgi:hypothetical protein
MKANALLTVPLCALFACVAIADGRPVSDPGAEAVAQAVCASDKPLLVFDSFALSVAQYGNKSAPATVEYDFNGDGIPDGSHGDLVAVIAGLSGKQVVTYETSSLAFNRTLAQSFENLAEDIESDRVKPAAIVSSVITVADLNDLNAALPSGERLSQDTIADNKARVLDVILKASPSMRQIGHALERIAAKGVPVFVAAGNDGGTSLINTLALFPSVRTVGALAPDGLKAAYSSKGDLWRSGRFVFKKVAGGIDINNDGAPEFADQSLSTEPSITGRYAGKPVAKAASKIPENVAMTGILPEGIYPTRDLLGLYRAPLESGAALHMMKQGPWLHHPSLLIFKESADGKLVYDPEGSGAENQRIVSDEASLAAPNICGH